MSSSWKSTAKVQMIALQQLGYRNTICFARSMSTDMHKPIMTACINCNTMPEKRMHFIPMLGLHSLSSYLHSVKRMIFCSGEKNIQSWIMNMKQIPLPARTSAASWCCRPSNMWAGTSCLQMMITRRNCAVLCSPQWRNIATRTEETSKSFQSCMKLHFFPGFVRKDMTTHAESTVP